MGDRVPPCVQAFEVNPAATVGGRVPVGLLPKPEADPVVVVPDIARIGVAGVQLSPLCEQREELLGWMTDETSCFRKVAASVCRSRQNRWNCDESSTA
jgi:hypothetical protein